jgi:hypothetical protein
MISGIASSPIPDKENELITSKAMEEAIPAFMQLPILHVDHTERPIGTITECRVLKSGDPILTPHHVEYDSEAKLGDTFFKAVIPEDGDTDDIWNSVVAGSRNKISIYGVRTSASPECKIPSYQRVSPCITKAIRLWSFSLVGDNAINPASYIKIAKSHSPKVCSEFVQKTQELIKAAYPEHNMAPIVDQQLGDAGVTETDESVVTKSELNSVTADVTLVKSEVAEVKSGIGQILEYLKKADKKHEASETAEEEEVEEEAKDKSKGKIEKCSDGTVKKASDTDYITKATLEPVLDLLVKAKVDLAIADIKKAYDGQIAEMKRTIEAFGDETIKKGGQTVILSDSGAPIGDVDNSFISNLNALGV